MGQQLPPRWRVRLKLPGAEDDRVSDRVGLRVDVTRRLMRRGVGEYPDARKVLTKALFHDGANAVVEDGTGATDRCGDAREEPWLSFIAVWRRYPLDAGVGSGRQRPLPKRLFRGAICLGLERILVATAVTTAVHHGVDVRICRAIN
jgi:hypothetical protein